jgi:GTP pyrophosphokinase
VDFAYAVHSEVGDTCVGAKINGKLKPLRTQLANGDQVEVICSKSHTPAPGWESFVVTGRARSRVRRFIRSQQRQQYVQLGRSIFERAMEQYDLAGDGGALERARTALKYKSDDDLYMALGEGNVTGRAVVEAISPEAARRPAQTKVVPIAKRRSDGASAHAVPIKGLIPGMAVHFAGCCHPLPGERIVGIVTTGKGVTVHTIDCETLHTFEETPERWIDLAWNVDPAKPEAHVGRISVLVANEPGMLGNMTTVIGRHRGNISNLKITSRSADFFEILVDVEVQDVRHLTNIIAALRADPAVNAVERARG